MTDKPELTDADFWHFFHQIKDILQTWYDYHFSLELTFEYTDRIQDTLKNAIKTVRNKRFITQYYNVEYCKAIIHAYALLLRKDLRECVSCGSLVDKGYDCVCGGPNKFKKPSLDNIKDQLMCEMFNLDHYTLKDLLKVWPKAMKRHITYVQSGDAKYLLDVIESFDKAIEANDKEECIRLCLVSFEIQHHNGDIVEDNADSLYLAQLLGVKDWELIYNLRELNFAEVLGEENMNNFLEM